MDFRFEFIDAHRIVMLHGSNPPPDSGWEAYLQQLHAKDVTKMGLLVFTAGGAPGPAQRRALNSLLAGRYFARSIVHQSVLVRGVVAAVSWFAPGVKAFEPAAWTNGASHAGFHPGQLDDIESRLRRMHSTMRDKIPWLETALAKRSATPQTGAPDARSSAR